MATCLVLALALTGCGDDSLAEGEARQDRIEELEPTTVAPTTAPPATTAAPTTQPQIDLAGCRSALNSTERLLTSFDDAAFDQAFTQSLNKCVNRTTWLKEAPSSLVKYLEAACILNPNTSVCR